MRFSDIHWTIWATTLLVLAFAVGAIVGCNTARLPFAKADARDLAAEIEQQKIELAELEAEAQAAVAAANADPTEENTEAADKAATALQQKARDTAKKIIDLESLVGAINASEIVVEETTEQAKGISDYLPSPWREAVLMAMTFGVTLVRGRSTAKVLAEKARSRERQVSEKAVEMAINDQRAIGMSVVDSLDGILTADQLAKIKQGPLAEALVDEAQGKL